MTQPMAHDERARFLYIHAKDHTLTVREAVEVQKVRATEWETGMVTAEDLKFFTDEARQQLAEEAQQ